MRHTGATRQFLLASMLLLVTLAVGLFVVPGRSLSLFVVSGNSMEPGIHNGDLVMAVAHPTYGLGDVVVYEHRDLGPVLHRIVRERNGQFVLQGDNRDEPDAYQVEPPAIRGRLALRIPVVGGVIESLHPTTVLGIVVVFGLSVFLASAYLRRRAGVGSHRRAHSGGAAMRMIPRGEFFALTSTGARIAAAFTAMALLAVLSIAMTQTLGTTHLETVPRSYQHIGEFEYEAPGAPGVYDDGIARTGDPVFRQLADRVETRFTYRFESSTVADVGGTYRVEARLTQANGWNRTLQIVPPTPFDGPGFTVSASLDFAVLEEAIEAMERQTGVQSRAYALSITPRVVVEGSVAGVELNEHFEPEQRFLLDTLVLQPQPAQGESTPSFTRSESGSVLMTREVERGLTIGGLGLSFDRLRTGSFAILAVSIPAITGWFITTMMARRQAEGLVIEAQYRDILVHSQLDQLPPDTVLVSVESIEELVRIAKTHNVPVLDEHSPGDETSRYYLVVSPSEAIYYYRPHRSLGADRGTDPRGR